MSNLDNHWLTADPDDHVNRPLYPERYMQDPPLDDIETLWTACTRVDLPPGEETPADSSFEVQSICNEDEASAWVALDCRYGRSAITAYRIELAEAVKLRDALAAHIAKAIQFNREHR